MVSGTPAWPHGVLLSAFPPTEMLGVGGLPWWPGVKNPPANAGNTGVIPVPGKPTCLRAAKTMLHNY